MKRIKLFVMVLTLFLAAGCMQTQYTKQDSALIVFKTPVFSYADMGFIYENESELKVEVYGSGQPLMSMQLKNGSICMSTFECMDEKRFNARVLHKDYPVSLLKDVFSGKSIFDNEGYVKSRNGFTQHIVKKGKYAIEYSVLKRQILFHDTINHIIIKVKKQG